MAETPGQNLHDFRKKVWIAASIIALIVVVLLLLKAVFSVLLLVLAAALIALYFHGLSGLLARKFNIPPKLSLAISITGSLLLLVVFLWFAGERISQQAADLGDTLPAAFEKLKERVDDDPLGNRIVERFSQEDNSKRITAFLRSFFKTTFGVLGDIYVVFFLGIFFTASPGIYKKGLISLVPKSGRLEAEDVINRIALTLTKWLKGMLFSMIVVFVLTAIGLAILGVPLWLVLALIAGLLSFIPNFGPLIALIPALLIGFSDSSTTALLILGLYLLVQALESNLITPKIQKKLINLPPAMIIVAQLIMGILTGGWGLVLATPLAAMLIVLVQQLYVNRQQPGSPG